MVIEFETCANHGETNPDGSKRKHHCCGCWHVKISDHDALRPYLACNECGEIRNFKLPDGVDA